ncbi:cobalamin B12-binding domain-containing protein [Candidatus Falkowbacteria bacterium]|nr:cobalamin B12-binding domain-containing protein [Candidatus Falkowbacteria bacterium]
MEIKLFRMIIPAYPEDNIFSRVTKKTTALGPLLVATAANKMSGWRVEVIDENNYHNGPRDKNGSVDHVALQKENSAVVVGFYCGLTSTMPRVWELAAFYKQQGALIVAGGWHVFYMPEESLKKGIDIIVRGDGEKAIEEILALLKGGVRMGGITDADEVNLNSLSIPDFGLLRFAKTRIYPIGRIRGCGMCCEFCSVKGEPRWADAKWLYETIKWLVETRGAREFFIVDDRVEEDKEGTVKFFKMIAEKYGSYLDFTIQARLGAAKDKEFLAIMKAAGVRRVCIGYESPIDEELKAMRKGINAARMVEFTKQWRESGFFVHAMFIFGYPSAFKISAEERVRQFKKFIRQAKPDSIQVLRLVPLVGTVLRDQLEKEGRILPLNVVGWEKYDGNFACFKPADMMIRELQESPEIIMRWFYSWTSWVRVPIRTIIMPLDYLLRGWASWYRGWWNDIVRCGARRVLRKIKEGERRGDFLKKLYSLDKGLGKT